MSFDNGVKTLSMVTGGLGVTAALMLAAPPALADPAIPAPPPPAPQEAAVQAAGVPAPPPEEKPHLSSPENLPPGTTTVPVEQESRGLGYLRDLYHAVQTQEISGADALLLLTQRPLDPAAPPPPGVSANPQPPTPAAPAPVPPPAAAPPAPPPPAAPPPMFRVPA